LSDSDDLCGESLSEACRRPAPVTQKKKTGGGELLETSSHLPELERSQVHGLRRSSRSRADADDEYSARAPKPQGVRHHVDSFLVEAATWRFNLRKLAFPLSCADTLTKH